VLAVRARAWADLRASGKSSARAAPVDWWDSADELDQPEHPRVHAFVATARADLHRGGGARDTEEWRAVLAAWTAALDPYRASCTRLRLAWALLCSRSGRGEAAYQLGEAMRTATELGARPLLSALRGLADDARLVLDGAAPARDRFGLTPRELEVLPLLVAGRTNQEIAAELRLSPRTVGVHVSRILHKLGASRRTEAADIARRAGLGGVRRLTDVPASSQA
jgi:DNA-binding CsgD family transcriptional regulator